MKIQNFHTFIRTRLARRGRSQRTVSCRLSGWARLACAWMRWIRPVCLSARGVCDTGFPGGGGFTRNVKVFGNVIWIAWLRGFSIRVRYVWLLSCFGARGGLFRSGHLGVRLISYFHIWWKWGHLWHFRVAAPRVVMAWSLPSAKQF